MEDEAWRPFLPFMPSDVTQMHWDLGYRNAFVRPAHGLLHPWPGIVAWMNRTRMELAMETLSHETSTLVTNHKYGSIATNLTTAFLLMRDVTMTLIDDAVRFVGDANVRAIVTDVMLEKWLFGSADLVACGDRRAAHLLVIYAKGKRRVG
jgi:hypothetical protein